MPKLVEERGKLVRVHLMLEKDDWTKWRGYFADNVGESKAIRLVMRDYLQRIEKKAEKEGVFGNV